MWKTSIVNVYDIFFYTQVFYEFVYDYILGTEESDHYDVLIMYYIQIRYKHIVISFLMYKTMD